jgi:hypothetical protein
VYQSEWIIERPASCENRGAISDGPKAVCIIKVTVRGGHVPASADARRARLLESVTLLRRDAPLRQLALKVLAHDAGLAAGAEALATARERAQRR